MKKNEPSLKKSLIRLGCAVLLIAISVAFLWWYQSKKQQTDYEIKVIPPTCTDSGYTLYTHKQSGQTRVDDVVEALGHSFGDWEVTKQSVQLQTGSRYRVCAACSAEETQTIYPTLSIPIIALDGDLTGIGKKKEVAMDARFISQERSFTSEATLKYQGHSTLEFAKKNYTLKFYEDAEHTKKNKLEFSHWNPENKYILKANYADPSGCRNLICADVWAQVTASRDGNPKAFTALSNYGAVDGFPIALYINGELQGLYTMNLHKDDDLFGMSDGEYHAIMIINHESTDEGNFRAVSAFEEDSAWEVEYCGTEDKTWAKDKLNALVTFVMESDDETFRRELSTYLNVESAIDYLLSIYALGLAHEGACDLVLVCYQQQEPWTASLYDMENAFGLSKDGTDTVPANQFLPQQENGVWSSGTGNLLWDRLLNNFYPQICSRYAQLRQEELTPEALRSRVETYTAAIPEELYQANGQHSPELPDADASVNQIFDYIDQRIPYLDVIFQMKEGQ